MIDSVPCYELGVVVGESYSDRGTSILTVLLVVIHQHFDPWTLQHDLALLRLFETFNYKPSLKRIPLMQGRLEPLDGRTAFVTGWGRCDFSHADLCLPRSSAYYPNEIQDPMLRSISFTLTATYTPFCSEYVTRDVQIREGMLCQGVARAAEPVTACLAAPGAPLVAHGKLVGLQSWGFGCGYTGDLPLVYTDLTKYHNWLSSNIALMASVSQAQLLQLFEATKSFVLRDVMYATRKYQPSGGKHSHNDLTMEPLPIDETLAMLKGKVYDLRDFLGKRFHDEKKDMYRLLRVKVHDRLALTNSTFLTEDVTDEVVTSRSDTEFDSDYYQELATNSAN